MKFSELEADMGLACNIFLERVGHRQFKGLNRSVLISFILQVLTQTAVEFGVVT
jgi:hypothetical protein